MNLNFGEIVGIVSIVVNSSILIGVYTKIIERITKLETKMNIIFMTKYNEKNI